MHPTFRSYTEYNVSQCKDYSRVLNKVLLYIDKYNKLNGNIKMHYILCVQPHTIQATAHVVYHWFVERQMWLMTAPLHITMELHNMQYHQL